MRVNELFLYSHSWNWCSSSQGWLQAQENLSRDERPTRHGAACFGGADGKQRQDRGAECKDSRTGSSAIADAVKQQAGLCRCGNRQQAAH